MSIRGRTEALTVVWGVGETITLQHEVLGAWATWDVDRQLPEFLQDVQLRGAEFIRVGVGQILAGDLHFSRAFPNSELVASIEQEAESAVKNLPLQVQQPVADALRRIAMVGDREDRLLGLLKFQGSSFGERYPELGPSWRDALARFEPLYLLHAQLRGLVFAADQAAAEIRARLGRAIARHGPFDDSSAALDFVAARLLRAERLVAPASAAGSAMHSSALAPSGEAPAGSALA